MGDQKPNGSVLKLAEAFQGVIVDAIKPVGDKIDGLETTMSTMKSDIDTMKSDIVEMNGRMGTYEANIGVMFTEQNKHIANQLKNRELPIKEA